MGTHRNRRRRDRTKSPLWARLMVVFGVILMVLSGGAVVFANVMKAKVDGAVATDDLLGDDARADHDVNLDGPLNYLLVGSDQRVNSEKPGLADTIIILHVPKGMQEAYLISIPRDTWVTIDCNGETYDSKINGSYSCGGNDRGASFQALATTINAMTGLTFDGGAIVDFEGFANVVGVIGTVELCLEETITSIHTDKTFKKGCARYGKEDALDIVRQRYQYKDGDFARQRMQQQFVKQLLQGAIDQGYVSDPTKINTLIQEVGGSLTLDTGGVSPSDLAYALRGITPAKLTMIRTPAEIGEVGNQSVVQLIPDDAQTLWDAVASDSLATWAIDNQKYVNSTADEK